MADNAGTTAQRIRIGLTGLAFAFLLVLLGSVISRSREDNGPPANGVINSSEADEPLATLGVAPGGETANNSSSKAR
jgi:hypothetical protein